LPHGQSCSVNQVIVDGVHDYPKSCTDDLKGSRLSIPWLTSQFPELPLDANDISVRRYARAYIMQLIEGFLFADKLNTLVHLMFLLLLSDFEHVDTYSWGGACLTWFCREFCQATNAQALGIARPLILLQVWAYDRFQIIAPQVQLQASGHCPLSARWNGVLAASEQSADMLLVYQKIFDRLYTI
ncbi:serine/threonine-protein phosphatase 7 long form homolog, partial [Benincasa hispida]|uniref:serine/threonine-protein phosphatase 7 long form homolog n=1 Tax=Benincasa hispida TaxID=102211 RepID=UPI0019021803